MRRTRLAALALVMAMLGTSCIGGGGGGSITLIAYFPRAVSLFPSAQVRVLGLPAGKVTKVEVRGSDVKVTMTVDKSVPIPADVKAQLVPQSLIGERYVQLAPAWKEGETKATDGHEISLADSIVPVEPDVALAELKKFLDALDPEGLGRLINNASDSLKGNGATLNRALSSVSQLVTTFAAKDQQLVAIVDNLDTFTAALRTRESQLGTILSTFSQATGVLASERANIERLVAGLASLSENGLGLVAEHSDRLRTDLATVARLAQSIDVNLGAVGKLLDAGPMLVKGIESAYNPDLRAINLRTSFSPLVADLLAPVTSFFGVPPVPCIPIDTACTTSAPAVGSPTVVGQAAGKAQVTSLAVTPVDDLLGVLRAPALVAIPEQQSTAHRVADAGRGLGGFLADTLHALVGAS